MYQEQSSINSSLKDKFVDCFVIEDGQVLIVTTDAFHLLSSDWKTIKKCQHQQIQQTLCVKSDFSRDPSKFIVGYTSAQGK